MKMPCPPIRSIPSMSALPRAVRWTRCRQRAAWWEVLFIELHDKKLKWDIYNNSRFMGAAAERIVHLAGRRAHVSRKSKIGGAKL